MKLQVWKPMAVAMATLAIAGCGVNQLTSTHAARPAGTATAASTIGTKAADWKIMGISIGGRIDDHFNLRVGSRYKIEVHLEFVPAKTAKAVHYKWSDAQGVFATEKSTIISYRNSGTATAKCVVFDDAGNADVDMVGISVYYAGQNEPLPAGALETKAETDDKTPGIVLKI